MPPGRIIMASSEPEIVVTLEGANVNWEKYYCYIEKFCVERNYIRK